MARFDDIYKKWKDKDSTGASGAVSFSKDNQETSAPTKTNSYTGTGRFATILENYRKNGTSFSGVDSNYINSFISDLQAFSKKAYNDSKNLTWESATSKEQSEARNKTINDLSERASAIRVYLNSNKSKIDKEAYASLIKMLNDFDTDKQNVFDTFHNAKTYYSQFGSQEEVDFHEVHSTAESRQEWYKGLDTTLKGLQAQKAEEEARWAKIEANANSYNSFEYSEMEEAHWNKMRSLDEAISKAETEKTEYERSGYNDKGQFYGSKVADDAIALMNEKDFSKYSQMTNIKNPTRAELDEADRLADSTTWDYDENGVLRDANGNVVEKNESGKYVSSKAKDYAIKDKLGLFLSATEQEMEEYQGTIVNGTWGNLIGEGIEGSWDQLTEDEIKVYYYLLNKNGQEAADKFLADMKTELNRRTTEAQTTATKEKYSNANAFEKILLNAATIPSNLLGGITGLAESTAHIVRGEDANPYSSSHSFSNFSNTVRAETAKELDELMPGVKIPVVDFTLGDLYQTVMSRFDSLASIAIGGKLGGALLATGAAASEMSRLYEEGASAKQMILGSLAAGAAEMVFESIGIDKLLSIKDGKYAHSLVMNILSQGGAEALEEGATEIANIISNAIIMGNKSDWNKLVKENNGDYLAALLEEVRSVAKASLGGFISGAIGGAIETKSKKLTDNEKAVVNKLVEEELAKPENKGKNKSSIKADIIERLENGDLDIDKIEEILGGESYKTYKETIDSEDAQIKQLEAQLEELGKKPNTVENAKKYDAVQKQIEDLKSNSKRADLKSKLSSDVYTIVKNDRLAESYNQRAKRSQAFEADLSEYDEAQRATVKNAIDSGILNNTKKTHDFVNMLAKLSADKGVAFDFTSNEKLKKSSFAIDGAVVNGYYDSKANKIGVNVNSAKALNSVVGHEITHVLEGTELYDELQKAVTKYAESKGDYKGRLDALKKLYKNVKDVDISKELTADLVGDYLFTDSDFVNRLSTENRTLFEWFFDEIKYLCRIATAGSKEARELEKVKKIFEDAFRNSGTAVAKNTQKNTADGGVKLALESKNEPGKLDPRTVTKGDVFDLLHKVEDGTIYGDTYIPVRINTPPVLIYWAKQRNDDIIDNNPIAISADKALNAMERKGNTNENNGRPNRLTADEVIALVENMNDPEYIVYQGENDRYVEVIKFNRENGDSAFAVIEIGNHKNSVYMNGYEGGLYNILVTTYPPKTGKLKELLNSPKNKVIYNKKKDAPQRTSSSTVPSVLNDASFYEDIVAESVAEVNSKVVSNADSYTQKVSDAQNEKGLSRKQEVDFSLSRDTEFSDNAIKKNNQEMTIDPEVLAEAKALRERIAARMNEIKDKGLVGLPEDIEGNTFFSNSSYGGSEENTTICPRSLASEAFVDAVSEYLGRPLTVEEQIYISQDLQGRSLTPECTYCYVATDRKAYRAFLGEYINQRDAVLKDYESGDWDTKTYTNEQIQNMSAEQKAKSLYVKFLDGRKPTSNMAKRFSMWIKAAKNGTPLIQASDLANMEKLMGDINSEFGAELKPQIVDAMKYAQSASWAKKRVSYVAYNGHILKWKQSRIDELNSHYGLRMYSFSDFHPAFVLENMQMITDASVRGLKMLGYTKDIDFVDIFAPTGMNINVSTFGFESGGNIYENNIIGAEWEKAKALREKYPNVGITFVATNDAIVEWALNQDWIDVVIPYHLVRTGAEVAKAFNYTNYTSESSDVKDIGWTKGDKKYIAPTDHNNDKATYFDALAKNHLRPRFERFQDHPNYMKLVNECRQSATESKPVQPTFNEEAAMRVLSKLEANGYYQPVGGSVDRMYEIAAEVADDMQKQIAPAMSLSFKNETQQKHGDYNVYGEDIGLPDVFEEETAPVKKTAKVTPVKKVRGAKASSAQKSVGAAESGFNPITHLQYEYGTIPEGEHPVRDDSMPVSTNGKDRVSYSARTVKGAAATPDELLDLLDKETAEGRLSYIPIKNSDTVAKAYDAIVAKGWTEAKGEWSARVRKGETGAEMVATGALLLNNAAKAGDTKAWLDILHDYRMMNTNTAQALQAARILKTLTPDDTLYMMERSVKQMVEDMKLDKEIVIDEDLAAEYIEAEDENAREVVRKKIVKDVARQIPPTANDLWTALRYLNMLGNVKTQVRNILGNVGMAVTSEVKNAVAATIEALANKFSGGKFQRTKSVLVNRDQYNAAKDDFANVEQATLNGGKYNDNLSASTQFAQDVMDERKIFKIIAPLEKYRKATNWAMEKGDLVFSRRAYARALAGYLKANGITETDFSNVDPQVMDEARAYAVQEAQENTFRDNNWLSKWASSALRGNKTPKIIKVLGEGLLPFRKTPANVLYRAEEYSPLGIINSTVKSIQLATGKGEVTGADVVNSWAKSLTGTGLFALGMMLSNIGALSGGADDDEEKEWFENLYGLQNYSITLGDYNFTIDFLSPSAMPILMGAQLNELMQDGNIELKELEAALLSLADPMIEMSMLQGLNDALDDIRYSESNLGQFLINSALNYLTQGITNSLVGQLERSFEGQRMTTYVDKDSPLPAWLQKAIGSVSAKIPGLDFQQIPYIDAWGETEDIAPLPGFLENVLSPSYVSKDVTDELFDELNRLNDAQSDYNVYPSTPEKTLTFDDADGNSHENYNLSAEEYVELAQLQGKTQKALVEQILASGQYSELTDKEKAKAIRMAYTYAKEFSRMEVLNADGFSSKWMAKAGEGIVDAIIAHTNEERTYAYDYPEKYAVSKAITSDFDKYKEYSKYLNEVKADKDKDGNTISGSAKEKKVAYIQSLDLDYGQKIILYKSEYKGDDSYDDDIIEYLRGRSDIPYEEKMTILKTLGIVE